MPDSPENDLTPTAPSQAVKWPSFILRAFGVANLAFAGAGLYFIPKVVIGVLTGAIGNTPTMPFLLRAFWIMTTINVVFLALLIFGGIRLLQLRSVGVTICNGAFVAEIVYIIFLGWFWSSVSTTVAMSGAAATGVGNMGIGPQLFCWYPVIGLVCLNLARRHINVSTSSPNKVRSVAPPSRLTAALLRILAVGTFIQVLLSAWWMERLVRMYPRFRRMFQFRCPHFPYLFSSLIFLNLALAVVLVLIAVSLWKLNKKALLVLSGVLALEWILLIVAVLISGNQAERFGLAGVMSLESFLVGPNAMLVIWAQIRTGYLLIAAVLIIATYISWRLSRPPA